MRLVVLIPTEVVLDETVQKIVAEAEDGWFCLEPRHIDFVTALAPGVLNFVTEQGHEAYLAVDEGTLVKCGAKVLVSTSRAVRGDDLATLESTVAREFRVLDEAERAARSALARLEAGIVRRFFRSEEFTS